MAKAEFTLLCEPTAADIIALFQEIKSREATDRERQDIETEMAQARQVDDLPFDAAAGCGYRVD